MAALRCVLARLSAQLPIPVFAETQPLVLHDAYRAASNDAIELEIDTTGLTDPYEQGTRLHYSLDLHYATRALTQNSRYESRVGAIAVMYGGRYAHKKSVYGVMFDRGFSVTTPDDREKDRDIVGSPREGCAIFLDAIAAARDPGEAFNRQVRFTTVHEIGHLFNLLHIESPINYLSSSDPNGTYEEDFFSFDSRHEQRLAQAATNPHVWPGGSDFFDLGSDLEQYDVGFRPLKRLRERRMRSPFSLRIGIARDHFRYFEPVELDVSLRLARSAPRSAYFPDVIDPGYQAFRIWIEEPNGERRLLRSPQYYCTQGLRQRLRPGEVFRRDISLFGESGGYTFRRVGVHRVWAELQLNSRTELRSNILEVELEPARLAALPSAASDVLRSPAVAELLYHRLDRHQGIGVRTLEAVVAEHPVNPVTPSMRYTLARAYLSGDKHAANADVDRAREHLKQAIDDRHLGAHQRVMAQSLLVSGHDFGPPDA